MEKANAAVQDQLAELTLKKAKRNVKLSQGPQKGRRRRTDIETRNSDRQTVPVRSQRARRWARALYDFDAELEVELDVCEGEEIVVVSQIDQNWVICERNGRQGHVPASYLELIKG